MQPKIDLRSKPPLPPLQGQARRIGPLPENTVLTRDTPLNPEEQEKMGKLGVFKLPAAIQLDKTFIKQAADQLPPMTLPPEAECALPEPVDINDMAEHKRDELLSELAKAREALLAPPSTRVDTPKVDLRKAPEPPPIPEPQGTPPSAIAEKPPFCDHCGWDQTKKDPPDEATTVDKLTFLQAWLGQVRYRKEYKLLAGHARVTFRTLTTEEADLCYQQALIDVENVQIPDPVQLIRTINDYRLCLGLAQLTLGQNVKTLPEGLAGWEVDEPSSVMQPKNTKVKQIVQYVYANVLVQEPVRRAVGLAWYRFQRFAEYLEAHVDDDRFWPPIGGRP